jgi:hypothetical protein
MRILWSPTLHIYFSQIRERVEICLDLKQEGNWDNGGSFM